MIKVFIATDFTIREYNHHYYAPIKLYKILDRYCTTFGQATLCTRCVSVQQIDSKLFEITGKVTDFYTVNNYKELLLQKDNRDLKRLLSESDLIIGRLPGIIPIIIYDYSRSFHKPFFSELMGEAWDSYWNHSFAGKLIAPYMEWKTKHIVENSSYVLYVTSEYLQRKYPCKCMNINASNVAIDGMNNEILESRLAMICHFNPKSFSVMTAANVDVRAKGHKYVIEAISLLKKEGIHVDYFLAGGGNQNYLRKIAIRLGVQNQVIFCGELSFSELCDKLDSIDIYVQPSLQEGLPRSVIEAMSRACPCIGSKTAGTPELLNNKFIFERKSGKAIAVKLKKIANIETMLSAAKENFSNAKLYIEPVLDNRRNQFFEEVKRDLCNQ